MVVIVLFKSFEVISLTMGPSYNRPVASEATQKDMGKPIIGIHHELLTVLQQNNT